ncbi:MAG: hypothetical protein WC183_00450 [Methanosarcina sp.]
MNKEIPLGENMAEILIAPKISPGWRICLTEEFCKTIDVNVGERIVILRNDEGDIVIRPNKAIA